MATLKAHTHRVSRLAFSPDGKTLASGGFEAKIFLWRAAPDEE
jgi:WD40 repeat protein